MMLTLSPEIEALIETRVHSGRYPSREAVVTAALAALESDEAAVDFKPGELMALIAEGEASGPPVDGEVALAELRTWMARR